MTIFNYTAKNHAGETVKGKVEAQDLDSAVKILRQKSLVIISLKNDKGLELSKISSVAGKVSGKEIVTFTRQFSTMVTSGLPLTEALRILQIQNKPSFGKIIGEILSDVQSGLNLADSMAKHEAFPKVYIALIRAGEAAGVLEKVALRLADTMEAQQEFRAKTKGAMVYPIIVIIGMIGVAAVVVVFVIPQLTSLFQDFGAELPLATRIMIGISDAARSIWGLLFVGLMFALGVAFKAYHKTPSGKYNVDKVILKLPVFGVLVAKTTLAEFTRTMSLLLGSGVSILESLKIMEDAIGNEVYSRALKECGKEIEKGIPLSESLARRYVFPPLVPQMASVGEETGKLDEVLLKISHYFESEAEQAIKNLTTAIEPLIMVVLGIGVAFLVFSVIMPIYELTSNI